MKSSRESLTSDILLNKKKKKDNKQCDLSLRGESITDDANILIIMRYKSHNRHFQNIYDRLNKISEIFLLHRQNEVFESPKLIGSIA